MGTLRHGHAGKGIAFVLGERLIFLIIPEQDSKLYPKSTLRTIYIQKKTAKFVADSFRILLSALLFTAPQLLKILCVPQCGAKIVNFIISLKIHSKMSFYCYRWFTMCQHRR